MENFKFILSSLFVLLILGFGGYWAFSTIESGSSHVDIQKQKKLEEKNQELEKQITILKTEIDLLNSQKEAEEQNEKEAEVPVIETPTVSVVKIPTSNQEQSTVYKYQSLINDLQKLVNGNIYLKNKSQGVAVGTVQKFLNIYNNTSAKIDNDYGLSTSNAVKIFQKSQGLVVDGEVGPGTLKKMISWLKNY